MKDRLLRPWPAILAIAVCCPLSLWADGVQTGTVDGVVRDNAGAGVPGATVTLGGDRGDMTAITDAEGVFRFLLVAPGSYRLTVNLEGMGTAEAAVLVESGGRRTLDMTLISATEETITVVSDAVTVDRYAVGLSASLEAEVAEQLSFKGRNYQSSMETLPGVVHDAVSRFQGDIKFAVNGGQDVEMSGFVDGVDISFMRFGGSPRALLPSSSLEEVRLEDAGFGAEYGRVVGGITNAVIKTGTNDFHGQAMWIPQSQKWKATSDVSPGHPRSSTVENSYEANLGGYLKRDKAWFFAAHSKQNTNSLDILADGSFEDISFKANVATLKLSFQPNERHYFTLTGVDSPVDKNHANVSTGDQFAVCKCDLPGEFFSGTWSATLGSSSFLEFKIASQENTVDRGAIGSRTLSPGADSHSPLGNNFSYEDRGSRVRYNTIGHAAGEGYITIPRDQANASVSMFRGDHQFRFGADYQDIAIEALNVIDHRFYGIGYDPNLPGGFMRPQYLNVYDDPSPNTNTDEILSVYADDRVAATDKWNIYLGLRMDTQKQNNDVGTKINDWTKVAPRFAANYDFRRDGSLVLKVNAGRYYQILQGDLVTREFSTLPNGRNLFNQYNWNPATLRYDRFARRGTPANPNAVQPVDPYYKDEFTVGIAAQFAEIWLFEATGITWELNDLYLATHQYDDAGRIFREVRNRPDAFREYEGLRLTLRRAMRDDWTMQANYTWSNNNGNNFGRNDNTVLFDDDLGEGLGGIELGTGATDATLVFREGRGFLDRTHNLNVIALRSFVLGSHTISLGGYYGFRSGERWGLRRPTRLVHPVTGARINTSSYREPRDTNQLEDTHTVNLTGIWDFPLGGRINGRVGVELVNITNEQEIIGINRANGRQFPGTAAFQSPREVRLQAGIRF
ncbi:MAG: carboxypeptidase regulatory-like domain-containing protein [Acidobacteria bacterium]|nr:carboxypeptidase regulatory-like domain-containing protein [Acidobacteriota bacterium]